MEQLFDGRLVGLLICGLAATRQSSTTGVPKFNGGICSGVQQQLFPLGHVHVCAAIEQQKAAPWSVAELEELEEDARDAMLGERLYALVQILEPERAGRVLRRPPGDRERAGAA